MRNRNLKNKSFRVAIVSMAAVFALVGCDSFKKSPPPAPAQPASPAPAAQKPAQAPAAFVQKQVSSVKLPPAQTNQFDFSNKKDPFKPFVSVKVAGPVDGKKPLKDALPIHSFDVSQFKLVGIVADPKGSKAMVVDPANKAYVVKPGMTIGKNEGKIIQITSSGIDVVEQFRDDNGKIRKETIRIPLLRKP